MHPHTFFSSLSLRLYSVFKHSITYIVTYTIMSSVSAVICMRENHGAAGPEQDRPSPATGGDPQSGQLLQGANSRAEGKGNEGPVQL